MTNLPTVPTGTVTFLFTDIEGSTRLAQEYSAEMPALLARHHAILYQAIQAHNGFVFRIVGDSFSAAFHTASDALNAALEAQRLLHQELWSPAPVRVRMGIHTGRAEWRGKPNEPEYEGYATLALTQRIMSAGHGGQILLSQSTYDLTQDRLPENTQLRDLGERQLKDVLRLERIHQLVVPDLPSEFPPLNTLELFKHNLPPELTSFIGRAREMESAKRQLALTRLLTFIGPGGTGKTRLSVQVAADLVGNFKDGAWLIELAPLADPAYIASTIASIFNLREVQGVPLIHTVTDYLRGKQLLLILDNCEHVVEACSHLSERLLHTCPKLKIMASSREALGIDGETVFRVPSLQQAEATQLFVERATKAEPRFQMTEHNASAIAQICSRLDGIPLAIELAAARVKLFTPEQIAQRLDDRFKLLTGGSRTALPRQQTLRALIDWSYQLLNETEQGALRRLAVFSGGWSFEAAEAVIGEAEAMEGLAGLVNKSLVNVEEQEGESRYGFLETIRQYALEKLLEADEQAGARNQHLEYFSEYARRAEANRLTPEWLTWLNRLETEHDNLRSALGWALESWPEAALQIVYLLSNLWLTRGLMTEGCDWCRAALARAGTLTRSANTDIWLARAYLALAMLCMHHGEHLAGQAAARQSVALARQLDDPIGLVRALDVLGLASAFAGDAALAFDSLHESESICRKLGYLPELASILQSLAYITMEIHGQAAVDQIQAYLEESLALSQGSVNPDAVVMTEGTLARLAAFRGNLQEARKHADRMLALHEAMGDQRSITAHNSEVAHVLQQMGHLDEALALYCVTIQEWREFGHRGAVAHQLECFGFIAKAKEQGERAIKLVAAAEALREVSSSPMTPNERMLYDREVAELRTGMDEQVFSALWAEGRSMTMEQAIEYALELTNE